jgi:hypothetical protein
MTADEARTAINGAKTVQTPLAPYVPLALTESYAAFPTDRLPNAVRRLVEDGASALGCDPAFIALPALAACAAAIGNSRALKLKRTWCEHSILWTAPVGESGTLKTPAYRLAIAPLHSIQRDWIERHKLETARFQNLEASEDEPPPVKPVLRRLICSDVTIEKLAEVLEDNPRGVLIARDELSGWFASFSRYKGKAGGSDVPNYLELYSCGNVTYDRKTGDRPLVVVDDAMASITGNIQPGILARCLTQEYHDSGLAARILMAMPPRLTKRWSEADVSDETSADYRSLIEQLANLEMHSFKDRKGPDRLELTPGARTAWIGWYDSWAVVQAEADDEQQAAYSKIEAVAARIALVHHVASEVQFGRPALSKVPLTSMECGIDLARWFAREVRRIYAILKETEGQKQTRKLCEWVQARGGAFARDLQRRSPSRYTTAESADAELNLLVEMGLARWEIVPSTEKGGRPTRRCILTDKTTTDTSDKTDKTDDTDNTDRAS